MKEAVIISAPKDYPEQDILEISETLPNDISLTRQNFENTLFAGIEWAMPTIVVVYLLKPFFEAFLKKFGEDVYELTKSRFKRLIIKNRKIKVKRIAASKSPDKLSKSYDQSLAISLKARLDSKIIVTVLISENISENEIEEVLDRMFASLFMLYEDVKKNSTKFTDNTKPIQLYLIANLTENKWELLTEIQMSRRYNDII